MQTKFVEITTNKTEITEQSVFQLLEEYILHNPEPKGGVCQVDSDERKALPAQAMHSKSQGVRPQGLFKAWGQWHRTGYRKKGSSVSEYLGKGARGRLQVDMKNGQITLNLNAVSLQPNLPKLAPQLA